MFVVNTAVIRPEAALPVSRADKKPERLQIAYELGRKAAEKRLSELIRFLHKEDNK